LEADVDLGDASTRNTIAEILYTSGTTGEPRGVVLTHGNFLANLEPLERGIDPYRKYERWFHPLRFVSLVPLSHVFGQFMTLFVPPLLGATVVFETSANPGEIVRTVKRERATALIAVPRMLDVVHSGIEREFEAQGQTDWLKRTLEGNSCVAPGCFAAFIATSAGTFGRSFRAARRFQAKRRIFSSAWVTR
jgi:long-subunit acyl-CoA synthetase (AMP-forming)